MVGDQLKSVKGWCAGRQEKEGDEAAGEEGEDPEVVEARREMEEKTEGEAPEDGGGTREMRQSIRDKASLE
nr:hypothetical protein BaRGS_029406 [Batillaria attramentaria]